MVPVDKHSGPWITILWLSVAIVGLLGLFSSDFRDIFILSVSTLWVLGGGSFSFVLGGIVQIFEHREENKAWKDSASLAWRYIKSKQFIRPAIVTYLIFLVASIVTSATKMQELRLMADGERKISRERLKERTKPQQSTNNIGIATSADLAKAGSTIQDSFKRWVIDSATNPISALKAIADEPIVISQAKTNDLLEFSERDEDLRKLRIKEEAKRQLAKYERGADNLPTLTNIAPIVNFSIERFRMKLTQLASANGDTLIAPKFDAVALSRRMIGEDFVTFYFEKNPAWSFKVYFRRENQDGHYGLYILSGGHDILKCLFDKNQFTCDVYRAPEGTSVKASGPLSDFRQETLIEAFRWVISIHKENNALEVKK